MTFRISVVALAFSCVGVMAQEPSGVVSGTVRSSLSKRALPSVRVELTVESGGESGRSTVLFASTGIQGQFHFGGLPFGSVTLEFSKAGFEARGRRTLELELSEDNDLEGLDAQLRPSAAITGAVRDTDGDPVTGASLQLWAAAVSAGVKSFRAVRTARTDDRGYYRLSELAPGRYYLSVVPTRARSGGGVREFEHSWGYFPGTPTLEGAERIALAWGRERTGVDFQLAAPPKTVLGGLVRTVGGAGACVSCEVVVMRPGQGQVASITTNESGMYLVRGLHPGEYVLRSNALEGPRFNAVRRVSLAENRPTTADMVLQRGSRVRGRVIALPRDDSSESDEKADSLTLTLHSVDGYRSGRLRARPVLSSGGEFELSDVEAGEYQIGLRGGPLGSYVKEISVGGRPLAEPKILVNGGSDLSGIEIRIAPDGSTVRGKVDGDQFASEGEVAPPGFAVVMPIEGIAGYGREYMGSYRTSDGLFEIPAVPPGSYHVFAIPRDHQWDLTDPIDLGQLRSAGKTFRVRNGDAVNVDAPFVAAPE